MKLNPFKKKQKDKEEAKVSKTNKPQEKRALKPGKLSMKQSAQGGERYAYVLLRPRITEKASFITEYGAYTFDVLSRATKIQVKQAIREVFNVTPIRVNMIKIPQKSVFARGKAGVKSGGKKAIVYLKKGDKIEFV